MKFTKLLVLISSLLIILNSCSSMNEVGKVLRNEKTTSTDEFLIKKKEPLTKQPEYYKMPKPGSTQARIESNQKSLEKILNTSETSNKQTKSSSTEESILKQIKK